MEAGDRYLVQFYADKRLAPRTIGTYDKRWAGWEKWCDGRGLYPLLTGLTMMKKDEQLATYLSRERRRTNNRANTLASKKSALRSVFLRMGQEDPTQGYRVSSVLAGFRRLDDEAGTLPGSKMPVTIKQLLYAQKHLLGGLRGGGGIWAGLMVGFFFLLRVSNMAAPTGTAYEEKYILLRRNMRYYIHEDEEGSGVQPSAATADSIRPVAIVVTQSKNDRLAFTRTQYRLSHPSLCVVKAMVAWAIEMAGLPDHWPFLSLDATLGQNGRAGRVITQEDIAEVLKAASRGTGLDPDEYSTHSLRIGGATHLHHAGAPDTYIMYMANWKSNTFRQYCRGAARRMDYQEAMVKLRLVMSRDRMLRAQGPGRGGFGQQ